MTLVIPRGQTAQPEPRGGPVGAPRQAGRPGLRSGPVGAPQRRRAGRGPTAAQYKRSPMATEGHRASE